MANWRKVTTNRECGLESWIDMDSGMIRHRQIVDVPLLQTKRDRAHNSEQRHARRGTQDHIHKIAEVPFAIVEDLKAKGIWTDPVRKAAWLADPANAYWLSDTRKIAATTNLRMI